MFALFYVCKDSRKLCMRIDAVYCMLCIKFVKFRVNAALEIVAS